MAAAAGGATETQEVVAAAFPAAPTPWKARYVVRWSVEQVSYADALISLFRQGLVPGCDEGVSLRAFLALRLGCDPARISERYTGKNKLGHASFKSTGILDAAGQAQLALHEGAFAAATARASKPSPSPSPVYDALNDPALACGQSGRANAKKRPRANDETAELAARYLETRSGHLRLLK